MSKIELIHTVKFIQEIFDICQHTMQHDPNLPDQLSEAKRLEKAIDKINSECDCFLAEIKNDNS